MKDKKVTASNQHRFIKRKSCLTNLLAFYGEVASSLDEGRIADIVYIDFSKAFNSLSHNIFIDKMMKHTADNLTLR